MDTLIIVDVQNDFLPGGSLAVPNGAEVISVINHLSPTFDLIVATQDWHPANHESFASQHEKHSIGQTIELNGLKQILWPDHCIQQSAGAECAKELDMSNVSKIFRKGTDVTIDSYSGFFDNGKRRSTGLADYLTQQKASRLFITGLATDYCVKFTALDAVALGLETVLIQDACRGVNLQPDDAAQAIEELSNAGVKIQTSESRIR